MSAPLTWKAHGSTRCVACGKRFSDTPDLPVLERESTDYTGGRPGYSANRPIQVMRRWHTQCLTEFEAQAATYREQVKADNRALIDSLREAAGLPHLKDTDDDSSSTATP